MSGQFSKKWEDLTIADNFIFCKVMQNRELCRELLEIILEIKISKIEYLNTEKQIYNFYDSKSVRLDVYVKDSDRIFDIEIQTGNYDDLILRSRYYLSASDVATTKRRTKYKNLKETFIIFICKDDPFGCGCSRYTKVSQFKETDKLLYDDKTHNVFYNCSGWQREQNTEIRDVLKFIYGLKSEGDFVQKMEYAVDDAKANSVFKDEYMYFEDVLEEEKEEARAAGMAEGRAAGMAAGFAEGRTAGMAAGKAEGKAEGKIEIARNMLKKGFDADVVAECSGLSMEKILELVDGVNFS